MTSAYSTDGPVCVGCSVAYTITFLETMMSAARFGICYGKSTSESLGFLAT